MEFLIATKNKGKVQEFRDILCSIGINLLSMDDCIEKAVLPEETGETFEKNAEIKAMYAYKKTGLPTISDDSGLETDALNGAPGIYSARYAGKNASDSDRIEKLLKEMEEVPSEKRSARFVCCICCILPSGEKIFSKGTCEGYIAKKKSGEMGFGYDSIFLTSYGKTFAELTPKEKHKISHRGKALKHLYLKLKNKIGELDNDKQTEIKIKI